MPHRKSSSARHGISTGKVGLAPGTLVYTGQQFVDEPRLSMVSYREDGVIADGPIEVSDLPGPGDEIEGGVQWLDLVGLHDTELIGRIGEHFGLHPLLTEDVLSVRSRPTFGDFDDHAFLSLKMLSWDDERGIDVEHVSLVMGEGYVISFQERPGDVFDPVRARLYSGRTRIRRRGADYLWYALIDAVVDQYLVAIDGLAGKVDEVEQVVWSDRDTDDVPELVHVLRAETVTIRRALLPLREEVERLVREPSEWFEEELHPFIGDLREHLRHIADALDSIRDALAGVMDAHVSMLSMKTNEVMKVLTIMASIFIPLTFVAGVYGMNFHHMPELAVAWAYPAVWGVMIVMALGMVVYFHRRGWL